MSESIIPHDPTCFSREVCSCRQVVSVNTKARVQKRERENERTRRSQAYHGCEVGLAHKVDQLCEQDHQKHSECELHGSKAGGSDEGKGMRGCCCPSCQSVSRRVVGQSGQGACSAGWMDESDGRGEKRRKEEEEEEGDGERMNERTNQPTAHYGHRTGQKTKNLVLSLVAIQTRTQITVRGLC